MSRVPASSATPDPWRRNPPTRDRALGARLASTDPSPPRRALQPQPRAATSAVPSAPPASPSALSTTPAPQGVLRGSATRAGGLAGLAGLASLEPRAEQPDGDALEVDFSAPLDPSSLAALVQEVDRAVARRREGAPPLEVHLVCTEETPAVAWVPAWALVLLWASVPRRRSPEALLDMLARRRPGPHQGVLPELVAAWRGLAPAPKTTSGAARLVCVLVPAGEARQAVLQGLAIDADHDPARSLPLDQWLPEDVQLESLAWLDLHRATVGRHRSRSWRGGSLALTPPGAPWRFVVPADDGSDLWPDLADSWAPMVRLARHCPFAAAVCVPLGPGAPPNVLSVDLKQRRRGARGLPEALERLVLAVDLRAVDPEGPPLVEQLGFVPWAQMLEATGCPARETVAVCCWRGAVARSQQSTAEALLAQLARGGRFAALHVAEDAWENAVRRALTQPPPTAVVPPGRLVGAGLVVRGGGEVRLCGTPGREARATLAAYACHLRRALRSASDLRLHLRDVASPEAVRAWLSGAAPTNPGGGGDEVPADAHVREVLVSTHDAPSSLAVLQAWAESIGLGLPAWTPPASLRVHAEVLVASSKVLLNPTGNALASKQAVVAVQTRAPLRPRTALLGPLALEAHYEPHNTSAVPDRLVVVASPAVDGAPDASALATLGAVLEACLPRAGRSGTQVAWVLPAAEHHRHHDWWLAPLLGFRAGGGDAVLEWDLAAARQPEEAFDAVSAGLARLVRATQPRQDAPPPPALEALAQGLWWRQAHAAPEAAAPGSQLLRRLAAAGRQALGPEARIPYRLGVSLTPLAASRGEALPFARVYTRAATGATPAAAAAALGGGSTLLAARPPVPGSTALSPGHTASSTPTAANTTLGLWLGAQGLVGPDGRALPGPRRGDTQGPEAAQLVLQAPEGPLSVPGAMVASLYLWAMLHELCQRGLQPLGRCVMETAVPAAWLADQPSQSAALFDLKLALLRQLRAESGASRLSVALFLDRVASAWEAHGTAEALQPDRRLRPGEARVSGPRPLVLAAREHKPLAARVEALVAKLFAMGDSLDAVYLVALAGPQDANHARHLARLTELARRAYARWAATSPEAAQAFLRRVHTVHVDPSALADPEAPPAVVDYMPLGEDESPTPGTRLASPDDGEANVARTLVPRLQCYSQVDTAVGRPLPRTQ